MEKRKRILNGNYANGAEISAKIHLPILCSHAHVDVRSPYCSMRALCVPRTRICIQRIHLTSEAKWNAGEIIFRKIEEKTISYANLRIV